jgi:hypothetical protein
VLATALWRPDRYWGLTVTSSEPSAPKGTGYPGGEKSQATAEVLSGDRLEAVLRALPDGAASPGGFAVAVRLPSDSDNLHDDPQALWYYDTCSGGFVTIYIGHEDPVAAMSVYDGMVTTSMPC